jgi:DNA-binding CsgD family transcriptional regulator
MQPARNLSNPLANLVLLIIVQGMEIGTMQVLPPDTNQVSLEAARRRFNGRRLQVFEQLVQRLPEKVIAAEMGISTNTVHGHIKFIYATLGVHSRSQFRQVVLGTTDGPVHRSVQDPGTNSSNVDVRQTN